MLMNAPASLLMNTTILTIAVPEEAILEEMCRSRYQSVVLVLIHQAQLDIHRLSIIAIVNENGNENIKFCKLDCLT